MGIFNEQSFDHPFASGIQGAPGVGFSLTPSGDYDMLTKKLTNFGAPSDNTDAATKKYVDDNSSGSPKTSQLTVDSNIDMKDTYRFQNLKEPSDVDEPATKSYTDNNFLNLDGTNNMTGNLDMDNNQILNLPAPAGPKQPTPLAFTDLKYLHVAGTNKMTNKLNMDNKKIINLRPPTDPTDAATKKYVDENTAAPDLSDYLEKDGTVAMTGDFNVGNNKIVGLATPVSNTDAATKKYVDDNAGSPDLSDYLEKDGSVAMTGDLNVGNNKIKNLSNPTHDNEAVTKDYVDKIVHRTAVQPSLYKDEFSYLMSSGSQWTDEIDGGNSFFIRRIGDLTPSKGNFHDYNHKVIFIGINKNSQGGYKYKMGINFYRLTANTGYTLCLEILNTDYQLWHKSQISVDKGTSTGLSIGNVSVRKLSHKYLDSKNQPKFMYYHRLIVNFRKLSSGNKFFLHILVNIPQTGTDLAVCPRQFLGVYIITYGIVGTVSNIDPDKVYDYHTAFDIHPTQVVYNVDINANQKAIRSIKLERQSDNSAATVAMVKELIPFTKNALYRKYFSEFYDFADADIYGLNMGVSGVVINSLKPNITLPPNKDLSEIEYRGLNVNGYDVTFSPSHSSKSTLCIVFSHWRNRNFTLTKYLSTNNNILLKLNYDKSNNKVKLNLNEITLSFTMPSSFNGKIIVLWLTENFDINVTKVKISNYSSTLTIPAVQYNVNQRWKFTTEDGVLIRLMYSPNFYDFDSTQFHKVMLQEKISGSYIV